MVRFINSTLENNPDVYFVTAKQAIKWTKLLPTLTDPKTNLTKVLDEQILTTTTTIGENLFDGNCNSLKPDLEEGETVERLILMLDDTYGVKKKDLEKPKMNATVLLDLQSELLFINNVVIYFVISLMVLVIFFIMFDKY